MAEFRGERTEPFVPPSTEECLLAIGLQKKRGRHVLKQTGEYLEGQADEVFENMAVVFYPTPRLYEPIAIPTGSDWLTSNNETGQPFWQFVSEERNVPNDRRNVVYFMPLTFGDKQVPHLLMTALCQYANSFFGIEARTLPTMELGGKVAERISRRTRRRQIHAGQVLDIFIRDRLLPADAFCLAGVTFADMYPEDNYTFVFGLASLRSRCGVYSLARYVPRMSDPDITKCFIPKLLRRTCLLMCHEIAHMFGVRHCIYYNCVMNGSNSLEEFDSKAIFLCPVCLRKLQHSCRFDIIERYVELLIFCYYHKMDEEVAWLNDRLKDILRRSQRGSQLANYIYSVARRVDNKEVLAI